MQRFCLLHETEVSAPRSHSSAAGTALCRCACIPSVPAGRICRGTVASVGSKIGHAELMRRSPHRVPSRNPGSQGGGRTAGRAWHRGGSRHGLSGGCSASRRCSSTRRGRAVTPGRRPLVRGRDLCQGRRGRRDCTGRSTNSGKSSTYSLPPPGSRRRPPILHSGTCAGLRPR